MNAKFYYAFPSSITVFWTQAGLGRRTFRIPSFKQMMSSRASRRVPTSALVARRRFIDLGHRGGLLTGGLLLARAPPSSAFSPSGGSVGEPSRPPPLTLSRGG